MTLFADILSTVFERRFRSMPMDANDTRDIETLTDELLGTSGEASGLALSTQILQRFVKLDDAGKVRFFRHLAKEMNIDPENVRKTLEEYERSPSKQSYRSFAAAAEPRRQELIRRLNQAPGATGRLVDMRADLLRLKKGDDDLDALDLDFRHLFASWFNRGFLVLRPINWESPAHVLEKIIAYEAVHAIDSWDELRRRLEPSDRRCFAFFHPAIPDEPLIFVEVALTQGIPNSIQNLLTEERDIVSAQDADTAAFYSISNCQTGLASISFGNSLIKQVAADLSMELPNLETFVTLSPIPGLCTWLDRSGLETRELTDVELQQSAAHYLLTIKRPDGLPLDPVARFHLGNGANIHALHSRADLSDRGIEASGGVMVNYLYDLEQITKNQEQFLRSREVVASDAVRVLNQAAEKRVA